MHINSQSNDPADEALLKLHRLGYAVAVFCPEELGGVKPDVIEDIMIHYGTEALGALRLGRLDG